MRRACLVLILLAGCSFDSRGSADVSDADVVLRTLSFDNSQNGGASDVPVLVVLNGERIDYDLVADPNVNLEFLDEDAPTPYEIERWDPPNTSYIWVYVNRIEATSTDDNIVMRYGPAVQSDGPDPGAVWGPRYEAVWHLDQDDPTGVTLENSVTSTMAGTTVNTKRSAGLAGGARTFVGGMGDSLIDFPGSGSLLDNWNGFTVEYWIYPDYNDPSEFASGEPKVFEKPGVFTLGRILDNGNGTIDAQTDIHFAGASTDFERFRIDLQAWTYIVYTHDTDKFRSYRNGVRITSQNRENQKLETSSSEIRLGQTNDQAFDGMLDELRIADSGSGGNYVSIQDLTMQDQLITYGLARVP